MWARLLSCNFMGTDYSECLQKEGGEYCRLFLSLSLRQSRLGVSFHLLFFMCLIFTAFCLLPAQGQVVPYKV